MRAEVTLNRAALAPAAAASRRGVPWLDYFFGLNLLLFLAMAGTVYQRRLIEYRGEGCWAEFLFYAALVIAGIGLAWAVFRRLPAPLWLLVLVQGAILAHFAGGLVHWAGARLYDHWFWGVRYDKLVHVGNSFVAALVVREMLRVKGVAIGALTRLMIVLTVLGLGACWEIGEYTALRTIPHNGVGDYDNNLQDLIANGFGGLAFLLAPVPGWCRRWWGNRA